MPILESVLIALGIGVAKYLTKEVLPQEWQDQIASELVSLAAKQLSGGKEAEPVAAAIGARVDVLYRRSKLAANEKTAALIEVIRTLDMADTGSERLIEIDLDAEALRRELIAQRKEATRLLSADGAALYEQMLGEASRGIMLTAASMIDFLPNLGRGLLQGQRRLQQEMAENEKLQEKLWLGIARLLGEEDERAKKFEEKYRYHLAEQLDRMEPFGIPHRDRTGQQLSLKIAFISLKLSAAQITPSLMDEQIPDDILDFRPLPPIAGYMGTPQRGDNIQIQRSSKQFSRVRAVAGRVEDLLPGGRRMMVEGGAGSGKSTLLQWLAVQAAQKNFSGEMAEWNSFVPFFIRLRRCKERGFPSPEEWPAMEAKTVAGIKPDDFVHAQLESGKAIVLVDGVDELPQKQRNAMLRELRGLVKSYPLARYVVTSRPTAVSERQWPEWRAWLEEAGFVQASLGKLEGEALDEFVDHWHDALRQSERDIDKQERAIRNASSVKYLFKRRSDLRLLAETPLLAAMICALYQDRGEHIPKERLKLYDECVEMLLERRDDFREVELGEDYVDLSYYQKIGLLQELAYWMLDNEFSAITCAEADSCFAGKFKDLDLRDMTGADVRKVFVQRAGLLQEPVEDEEISFHHRTFQEYLAAKAAVENKNLGVLVKHARVDLWRETIILATGIAYPADRAWLLRKLLSRADSLKTDQYRRQVYLLALACLETATELDAQVREEVVTQARSVFPPHSEEEADMVARGGSYAIDLLGYDPDYPAEIAVYCIKALAAIGGARAMTEIAAYREMKNRRVQRAIGDAWNLFEAHSYAEIVLAGTETLALSAIPAAAERLLLLPNLTQLDLRYTQVSDLSTLPALPNLTQLDLRYTQVSDLSTLPALPNLTQLYLRSTQVSDLSTLPALPNLTQLDLSSTQVSDLSTLPALPNLTQLVLIGTQVSDLSTLPALPNLTQLYLSYTQVSDLSTLSALPNLTQLYLSYTQVSDLSTLPALPNLTQLDLSYTQVSDLSTLPALPNLTQLDLRYTQVSDLSTLPALPNLTQLVLIGTQVSDLSTLPALPNLTQLDLRSTQVSDLSTLPALPNLTQLYLRSTQVSDLSTLPALPNLTQLYLRSTQVSDLSTLPALPNLTQLVLIGTQVSDLSTLPALPNLTQLDLRSTQVSDLSTLPALPNLTAIIVDKDKAAQLVATLAGRPRQRGLAVYTDYVGGDLYRYLPRA